MTQDVVASLRSRVDVYDLKGMFPGDIADLIRKAISDMLASFNLSNLTPEQKQAILAGVKSFYDNYVRPFDIPYVPPVAERFVDDWIWMASESFLRAKLGL